MAALNARSCLQGSAPPPLATTVRAQDLFVFFEPAVRWTLRGVRYGRRAGRFRLLYVFPLAHDWWYSHLVFAGICLRSASAGCGGRNLDGPLSRRALLPRG